jgi:ATP-GRASP peptide maturase of grasp-with-spasm system
MVLILSTEGDLTTKYVIDWLNALQVKWIRLNGEDIDECEEALNIDILSNQNKVCKINNILLHTDAVKVVWNRRTHNFSKIKSEILQGTTKSNIETNEIDKLYSFLRREVLSIHDFIKNQFQCTWLDHFSHSKINKLIVLKLAKRFGLIVPDTIITNNKQKVKEFVKHKGKIITKPVGETFGLRIDDQMHMLYTSQLDENFLDNIEDEFFFPSLFQECIEKMYEIRSFYLEETFYSMAIFSQLDEQTTSDFRNYNYQKRSRMIPFNLPTIIEDKLKNLMEELKLKHGSIDLIKSLDEQYYFLEVNPVGQFGMVSTPCNYYLNEKIAQTLKSYDNN